MATLKHLLDHLPLLKTEVGVLDAWLVAHDMMKEGVDQAMISPIDPDLSGAEGYVITTPTNVVIIGKLAWEGGHYAESFELGGRASFGSHCGAIHMGTITKITRKQVVIQSSISSSAHRHHVMTFYHHNWNLTNELALREELKNAEPF